MDTSASFDPDKLTLEEKDFILNKIENNTSVSPTSSCILWAKKAQKNGYPQMKLNSKIAAKFGNPDRPFNPASILYSIKKNVVLLKVTDMRLSHLCHVKFCVNLEHLIIEPLATNIQRNGCRGNHKCVGHGNSPDCLL